MLNNIEKITISLKITKLNNGVINNEIIEDSEEYLLNKAMIIQKIINNKHSV